MILVVGVNGTGKTTTIGKLACTCATRSAGPSSSAQATRSVPPRSTSSTWAERAGAEFVGPEGSDPGAVAFDAVAAAASSASTS